MRLTIAALAAVVAVAVAALDSTMTTSPLRTPSSARTLSSSLATSSFGGKPVLSTMPANDGAPTAAAAATRSCPTVLVGDTSFAGCVPFCVLKRSIRGKKS